jgi:hypothetical protein
MKRKAELHSCTPIGMQPATLEKENATDNATDNATIDFKALALKGLKRNKERNRTATKGEKQRNSDTPKVAQKLRQDNCQTCEHTEHIESIGKGCKSIVKGYYQNQWSVLDTLDQCPRGHWN